MINRRQFLKSGGAVLAGSAAASQLACGCSRPVPLPSISNNNPRKALVLWYSQAGHTARMGKLIAHVLAQDGLEVTSGRLRDFGPEQIAGYDLLLVGSPVYYIEVPPNVRDWLDRLPSLSGVTAASWVTCGGGGHNEHNVCCQILERLAERGAAPAGMTVFHNMNTFAATWSFGGAKHVLKFRNLPNDESFEQARQFARGVLRQIHEGKTVEIDYRFVMESVAVPLNLRFWTKLGVNKHRINPDTCIECGACERACPVGAITVRTKSVYTDRCIVCLGCLNNCPVGAIEMELVGRKLTGFKAFCEENNIEFAQPPELSG